MTPFQFDGLEMAVIVTPEGKASDNAQFPSCPYCGGRGGRRTTKKETLS